MSFIGAKVYNNANISVPNAQTTLIAFNSEMFDTDSMHSTSTNPSRITINTAGKYLVHAHVEWVQTGAAGIRQIMFAVNGNTTNWALLDRETPGAILKYSALLGVSIFLGGIAGRRFTQRLQRPRRHG